MALLSPKVGYGESISCSGIYALNAMMVSHRKRFMLACGLLCLPVMVWPAWETSSSTDEMTSEKVQFATATSTNTVELNSPYGGPQNALLELRMHPRYGHSLILALPQAQFLCGMDDCTVLVRFDDGAAEEYAAGEPADHSNNALFIHDYDTFVLNLVKAKRVKIEARFFQSGTRVFTFDVSNLPAIFSEDNVKTQRRKEVERKQKQLEDQRREKESELLDLQFKALIWPTEGRLMYGFGKGDNQKGIGITGKVGQSIVASFAGKVVYSGSGLAGYGKVIILKHNISYLTTYANNGDISVNVGDQVHQGQQIGHMGVTDEGVPLLHFEVRRLGKPVDPLISLPKR